MNSPKYINYETRPYKFTERKMLLSSFTKICSIFREQYQYIGFGGLTFTDFKLFHKELHIKDMYSIEGGEFTIERLNYNVPYSFIKILKYKSTQALTQIDLKKKSIVWLDYDDVLEDFMFEDLNLLINNLPIGSIYLMTCNRQLRVKETDSDYKIGEFIDKFGYYVPFDLNQKDLAGNESSKTIRKMLLYCIDKLIEDRNRNNDPVKFNQLYNIVYEENRGARMFTFGGVILDSESSIDTFGLDILDFISTDDIPYRIDIPNLTNKEFQLIERDIGFDEAILVEKNVVKSKEIKQYKQVYKYIPHFHDIRI